MKIFLLFIFITFECFAEVTNVTPYSKTFPKTAYKNKEGASGDICYNFDDCNEKKEMRNGLRQINQYSQTDSPYFVSTQELRGTLSNKNKENIVKSVANYIENNESNSIIQKKDEVIKQQVKKKDDGGNIITNNFEETKSEFQHFSTSLKDILASDEEIISRPNGIYKGFLLSFLMAGTSKISGFEERPTTTSISQNTGSNQWERYNTVSANKLYMPSAEIGIFVGLGVNSWIRSHLDLSWTYLYGTISNVSTDQIGSPGGNFFMDSNFLNGHLFTSTMNIFLDPYQKLKIWPTIGTGIGIAYFVFNKYNDNALLWPVVNLYAGFNFMTQDKKSIISLGYKLQFFLTGNTLNYNPLHDNSGIYQDGRPTNQDFLQFGILMLHKLELSIKFF